MKIENNILYLIFQAEQPKCLICTLICDLLSTKSETNSTSHSNNLKLQLFPANISIIFFNSFIEWSGIYLSEANDELVKDRGDVTRSAAVATIFEGVSRALRGE